MRLLFSSIIFVFLTAAAAAQGTRALFIIVDGIPADVIERVRTPHLDEIARYGGYARAFVGGEKDQYSQTPTISAVGYNSLLTGTWVNKHNVWDNDIASPNYHYWNIFRLLKRQYPARTTAVYSTWLDNRTKLVGSEAKEAGNLQPEDHFDGMELDTVAYPHDTAGRVYLLIDEAVTDTAAARIRRHPADLSWIYLEYTDEMGHRHGNSSQMDEAVSKMDNQIGRIWEAIRYREKNFHEKWQIWITTDHGRENNGYHHGGQSERERTTWIVTNAKQLNERFRKSQPGIVDIMPSLARFLRIDIPADQLFEIDGVPLIGKISATELTGAINNNQIHLTWRAIDKEGNARIWIAASNNFKNGGKDEYRVAKVVPVAAGRATIDVKDLPSDFYKIAIEMPNNTLNRWIMIRR